LVSLLRVSSLNFSAARIPARRDYVAELNEFSVKGSFQSVRQHPLNMELKREPTAASVKSAPVVKKTVVVSKSKGGPIDDPLSALGNDFYSDHFSDDNIFI
jgi:hypothetical protein